MILKNRFSLFIATFLIIGFFFIAMPEEGYSGIDPTSFGCCGTPGDSCIVCELGDCAIRGDECNNIGGAFMLQGSVCDSNIVSCTDNFEGPGCCVLSAGNCNNNQSIGACDEGEGLAWFLGIDCAEIPQCAPPPKNVPTLSGWGLISLAIVLGILGILGFIVMRRRKATA